MADTKDITNKNNESLSTEFQNFMSNDEVQVSAATSLSVLNFVREDLATNNWSIFAKVLGLHAVASAITLSICPQFGISAFGDGIGLIQYFSSFGIYGCLSLCGGLYTISTLILCKLILKNVEWARIQEFGFSTSFAIGSLSIFAFMFLGSDILFKFGLVWLTSAVLAGFIFTQLTSISNNMRQHA